MMLSAIDEQEVRTFATTHPEELRQLISEDAKVVHAQDNFLDASFDAAMFMDIVTNLSVVLGGAVAISKTINSAQELFKWARAKLAGEITTPAPSTAPALTERALVLLFEAFVNRRAGVKEPHLATILGSSADESAKALELLATRGVARKAADGSWKYVRST